MRPEIFFDSIADPLLFLHRSGSQRCGRQCQTLHQHGREIYGRLKPVLIGNVDDPAIQLRRGYVLLDIVAAHHVQDHVHAAFGAYNRLEVFLAIVDRPVGTKFGRQGAFFGAACRGKNFGCTRDTRHLDRHHAYAAGSAMTQEVFACAQADAVEHIGPYGKQGFRQAGRIYHVHACGNGQK